MSDPSSPFYGIPVNEIARICGVDLATARRWKRGATCPPKTAEMIVLGDLGCFDPAWAGWKLSRGLLISPEGWEATPGHVRAMKMINATLGTYRRENESLKAALRTLAEERGRFEDQPRPEDWIYSTG